MPAPQINNRQVTARTPAEKAHSTISRTFLVIPLLAGIILLALQTSPLGATTWSLSDQSEMANDSRGSLKTPTPTKRSPALGAGNYEDNNPVIVYSKTWTRVQNKLASGGTVTRSKTTSATASLTVAGVQSFQVMTVKGPDRGIAKVLVDGKASATWDLYSVSYQYKVLSPVYKIPDTGQHKIAIQVSGSKNSASSGAYIVLDEFIVLTGNASTATPTGTVVPPSTTTTSTATPSYTPTPTATLVQPTPTNTPTATTVVPTPTGQPTQSPGVWAQVVVPDYGASPVWVRTTALAWYGKVSLTDAYTDLRFGYNDQELYAQFLNIDRYVYNSDAVTLELTANRHTYKVDANLTNNVRLAIDGQFVPNHITAVPVWRGDGINGVGSEGWWDELHIPWTDLGGIKPDAGTSWGVQATTHNENGAGSTDTTWASTLVFGLPYSERTEQYAPPTALNPHSALVRNLNNGQRVVDAVVGGGTLCGEPADPYSWQEWGDYNWATKYITAPIDYLTVQNQQDVADWRCFSRFYGQFPLDSLPPNKVVISATLTLHNYGHSGYGCPSQCPLPALAQVFEVDQPLDPSKVTWNNGALPLRSIDAQWIPLIDNATIFPHNPVTWDVSAAVARAYAQGRPFGYLMYDSDTPISSGEYMDSSRWAEWQPENAPSLNIIYGDPSGVTNTPTVSPTLTPTWTGTPATSDPYYLGIDSGGGAAGNFVADTDYSGGNTYSTNSAIDTSGVTNPAPQIVYQTERWAGSTYSIPGLIPGSAYTVRLHFAELLFTDVGQRKFNVIINEAHVLTDFDIFAAAGGPYIAVVKEFQGVADSTGQIVITFATGSADNPKISGIEILGNGSIPTNTPTATLAPFPTPQVTSTPPPTTGAEWPMVAANARRTSWSPEEVRGPFSAVWYRPIDPYIDNKVQVVAAAGKVFVATSKGLYAFDANNGAPLWTFGTELPLGNSPTYFNGILYVGGFDHQIYAIKASDGTLISGWTFVQAGAGYDTNPLVVSDAYTGNQPIVFAGNRDGYFYALDGNTGALKWKFQTGGPITYSAAYKNGTIYFASNDSYAYALNVDGSLAWKSAKFPGVGFDMFWPVIYTEPTSGKDYVIFSGSVKGGAGWICDTNATPFGCDEHSQNSEMYKGLSGLCGPTGNEPYAWVAGTQTIRCDAVYNYFNNNPKWNGQPPWWRFVFVLDRNTGVEQTPYPPFNYSSGDGGSQGYKHPPIVGEDGVLYTVIGYLAGGNGGATEDIAGWKFGTPYISRIIDEMASGTDGASDEPRTITAGGNLIYYGEGVNHEAFGAIEISKPLGNNAYWKFNPAGYPGTGVKYTSLDLSGKFGGNNGVYSYFDGILNQSPVPYHGMIYLINGNVLFALNSTGTATAPLPMAPAPSNLTPSAISTTKADLQQRLNAEVQKMVNAGPLRPGFLDSGGLSQFMVGGYDDPVPNNHLTEYFHNPSDTVTALVNALPYLSTSLQSQVKAYLQNNYGITNNVPAPYSFINYASVGWKNGARRESSDDTPEITAQLNDGYDANSYIANGPRSFIWVYNNLYICGPKNGTNDGFPPDSFYGAWKYAQTFPGTALPIFNLMKNKLCKADQTGTVNDMTDANLVKYPYILNEYIVGYRGYMELEKLAGLTTDISQSSKYPEYTRLVNLRLNNFSRNVPWDGTFNYNNGLNASRNFIYLTPELAGLLNPTQVQAVIDQYQTLTPFWFVEKYDRSYGESYYQPLHDSASLFQARALALKQPFSELIKYLDAPAFQTGDLFFIQNLVAALNASPTPKSLAH